MVQIFWLLDFLGILLARFILGIVLLIEAIELRKENKVLGIFKIGLGGAIIIGAFSTFSGFALLISEIITLLRKDRNFKVALLKIALALILIFIGPGWLSLDRIFNLRW